MQFAVMAALEQIANFVTAIPASSAVLISWFRDFIEGFLREPATDVHVHEKYWRICYYRACTRKILKTAVEWRRHQKYRKIQKNLKRLNAKT
jgi:hypothetical protein